MKNISAKTGFLQALGIALYVGGFAFSVQNISAWAKATSLTTNPMFGMMIFLLVFIISATICASLMFGHPISLFMKGEKKKAIHTVFWTVGWLVVFLGVLGIVMIGK
jgi:hypothetical protein